MRTLPVATHLLHPVALVVAGRVLGAMAELAATPAIQALGAEGVEAAEFWEKPGTPAPVDLGAVVPLVLVFALSSMVVAAVVVLKPAEMDFRLFAAEVLKAAAVAVVEHLRPTLPRDLAAVVAPVAAVLLLVLPGALEVQTLQIPLHIIASQ